MHQPVTILHVRNSVAYGGVETTLLGWLDHIDRTRFHCPVSIFKNSGGSENAFLGPLKSHGHEILYLPWGSARSFFKAVEQLIYHIQITDARILHTHDWRSDVIGYFAARKTGIPIVTTIYVWFHRPFKIWLFELIDSWFIRRFDCVTAVCEATRRQTVARGVKEHRTSILISGMHPDRFSFQIDRDAVRQRYGFVRKDVVFVFAARLHPEKGHSYLLDAFGDAATTAMNIKLLLLGVGPLDKAITAQIARLGLKNKVVMPGFADDVPSILKAMDVMVHTSLAEGIPLAVYEGMLAGLPIIGSNVDGIIEVVFPGKTGWIVPPRDSAALAKAIVEAAQRPDLRTTYGEEGRKYIVANYNMEIAVDRIAAVYERLLSQKRCSRGMVL